MIGRLRGTLLEKNAPDVLIECGGVGYDLSVPMTCLYLLPAVGAEAILYTHLSVREDAQQLFGFSSKESRQLFRELIKVNGVGPKLAITIMSGIDADDFVRCVHQADSATLVRLPGVGKKTAERLIIEMRDRLKDWQASAGASTASNSAGVSAANHQTEAEAALIALGYKPQEASKAIAKVASQAETSEELIRLALKNMVSQ